MIWFKLVPKGSMWMARLILLHQCLKLGDVVASHESVEADMDKPRFQISMESRLDIHTHLLNPREKETKKGQSQPPHRPT